MSAAVVVASEDDEVALLTAAFAFFKKPWAEASTVHIPAPIRMTNSAFDKNDLNIYILILNLITYDRVLHETDV